MSKTYPEIGDVMILGPCGCEGTIGKEPEPSHPQLWPLAEPVVCKKQRRATHFGAVALRCTYVRGPSDAAEVDWSRYLPPAPLPDTGPKEFKAGQVWAVFSPIDRDTRSVGAAVVRVQKVSTSMRSWCGVKALAGDRSIAGMGCNLDGGAERGLHAVLLQDVGEPHPRPVEEVYGVKYIEPCADSAKAIAIYAEQAQAKIAAAAGVFYGRGLADELKKLQPTPKLAKVGETWTEKDGSNKLTFVREGVPCDTHGGAHKTLICTNDLRWCPQYRAEGTQVRDQGAAVGVDPAPKAQGVEQPPPPKSPPDSPRVSRRPEGMSEMDIANLVTWAKETVVDSPRREAPKGTSEAELEDLAAGPWRKRRR